MTAVARRLTLSTRILTILIAGTLTLLVLTAWRQTPAAGTVIADEIISSPSGGSIALVGRGPMARFGNYSVLLYLDVPTYRAYVYVRDEVSGAGSHVLLPPAQPGGDDWWSASYAVSPSGELSILSGAGPVYVRHYQLTGSPMPTGASLLSVHEFGNTDSRAGSLISLASGGLVGVWTQQGMTGPQGMSISYRTTSGTWGSQLASQHIPTRSSKHVAVQHPADGSVWIFSNADAWGAIGAVHLTEGAAALSIDWADGMFLSDGSEFGVDPENPDLVAAPDLQNGTVVLGYQSDNRKMFSSSPFVAGSHIALAKIAADRSMTLVSLPVYVERISRIGLVVAGGETWLAFRPILPDLNFNQLFAARSSAGIWSLPSLLGTLSHRYNTIAFADGSPSFVAEMADGRLHWLQGHSESGPAPTSPPSPSETPSPTPSPTQSPSVEPTPDPSPTTSPTASPTTSPSPSPSPSPAPTKEPRGRCKATKNERCT